MNTSVQRGYSQALGNMGIYDQVRAVPEDALSPITGGPMKGKSNINPQWRIQMLTQIFGPAGIGWKIEQVARWTESTPSGEIAVFCEVNLYVRNEDGAWSEPIFGQGGNKLVTVAAEWQNGQQVVVSRINDEAYKMAYTDAVSVACKALGFASDVYFHQEKTKYGNCWNDSQEEVRHQDPTEEKWPWTRGLKELTPKSSNWAASLTQVSQMGNMGFEQILKRISAKFNITRENFDLLLSSVNAVA